jgi:hypothetical protein
MFGLGPASRASAWPAVPSGVTIARAAATDPARQNQITRHPLAYGRARSRSVMVSMALRKVPDTFLL